MSGSTVIVLIDDALKIIINMITIMIMIMRMRMTIIVISVYYYGSWLGPSPVRRRTPPTALQCAQ